MVETPADELSLRDILETLKRQWVWLLALPVLLGVLALIYGFFIAEPTYASTATLSVAPVQVQAQLEQRIQVQQATPITFEGLRALALSEETVGGVWEALRKEGRLPTRWQDRGSLRGVERMMRDLKVKDISPKLQAVNPNQVPPVVASLTVNAPDPQVAAKAANLWVEAVKRRVNAIPLARLEASLKALEEQVTPAEKAYREAQARWEAFNKTTTLPQDKAELDAKTQERVGLDTELAGLEGKGFGVQPVQVGHHPLHPLEAPQGGKLPAQGPKKAIGHAPGEEGEPHRRETPQVKEKKKEGQEGGGKEVAPGVVQPPHGQNGHQEERKEQ